MSEALPPSLSPFATDHPASSAYRITMSPHEWIWTQEEQEAMARAIVAMDAEREQFRQVTLALRSNPRNKPAGRCGKCGTPTFGLLCAKCKGEA